MTYEEELKSVKPHCLDEKLQMCPVWTSCQSNVMALVKGFALVFRNPGL